MEGWQGFEYAEVVQRIAAYLVVRRNQVDVLGNMRDDYVSDLAIEALLASRTYQKKHGRSGKAEARYVQKSLWNFARDLKRLRYRRNRYFFQTADFEQDPVSLESWYEARESIERLQKRVDKGSLKVLTQLAEAEGDVTEAWKMDPWCHRTYFYEVVRHAREAGKKALQN